MSEIGDRERVQALLAEYTSLRSETNARISSSYTILGAIAAVNVWLSLQAVSLSWGVVLTLGILGFAYCARVLTFDALNAARRVREIEQEINRRLGQELMVWESERGGLNASYWRALFFLPPTPGNPDGTAARDPSEKAS